MLMIRWLTENGTAEKRYVSESDVDSLFDTLSRDPSLHHVSVRRIHTGEEK